MSLPRRFLLVCVPALMALPGVAAAHGFRPALLEIHELETGRFQVVWKEPPRRFDGTVSQGLDPELPGHCLRATEPSPRVATGIVRHWIIDCGEEGLRGHRIAVSGLDDGRDALLRIWWADDTELTTVLRSGASSVEIPLGRSSPFRVVVDYLQLGGVHILGGYDHLLFVLGLLLLLRSRRLLISTITCFTVGHSLSLALVTLGLLSLPSAPVEATIALSIILLAVEASRPESGGFTWRYPWIVAICFGFLHGFGFAGALSDVGMPPGGVPLALLGFNLGVEVGQLIFIFVCLGIGYLLMRVPDLWRARGRTALIYGMGSIAAFWCFQRVAGFWA